MIVSETEAARIRQRMQPPIYEPRGRLLARACFAVTILLLLVFAVLSAVDPQSLKG